MSDAGNDMCYVESLGPESNHLPSPARGERMLKQRTNLEPRCPCLATLG